MRHRNVYYVEMVLSDLLTGLHDEYKLLKVQKNCNAPSATEVARTFIGSENNIHQYAAPFKLIPRTVIDFISSIMNEEHPKLSNGSFLFHAEQEIF